MKIIINFSYKLAKITKIKQMSKGYKILKKYVFTDKKI